MMQFYLERDDGPKVRIREGKWITLPMDQDELDQILDELGIVDGKYNYIVNKLEDDRIGNLQTTLPVDDFAEINELASVFETLSENAVKKLSIIVKRRGEITVSEFYDLIEDIDIIEVEEDD